MNFYTYIFYTVGIVLLYSCDQKVSVKNTELTAINQLSYTDVIYKSEEDTVLTASFDGKIKQIIRKDTAKRLIIDISDEIYGLAYNDDENLIYAATYKSGILVINEKSSSIEKAIQLEEKWANQITYDPQTKLLMTYDLGGNTYLLQTDKAYEPLSIPKKFEKMVPKSIINGVIYFDGTGTAGLWKIKDNQMKSDITLKGKIVAADQSGNILSYSHDQFFFYHGEKDSLLFNNKHPNWPIYVSSLDSVVRVPKSLYLTTGIIGENHIFTSGIDRSIRKWKKSNGEFSEDLLGHKATISAMDISESEKQLVSVDLRGGIRFWDLKE
jgi:WD40 repeat protein